MRALVLGAGAGLLAVLALAPSTGTVLGELAAARAKRAELTAAAAAPERVAPIVASGLAIRAADPAAARAAMMARIQRLAKAGGILVEETGAVAVPEGLAGLRVRVSGAEKAVLAFAEAFERESPLMRLRRWRLEPVPGGIRLTGDAIGAWQ